MIAAFIFNLFFIGNNRNQVLDLINKWYFFIHNLEQRYDGALPYFGMGTGNVIYF
jgi:hypothetical protein